MQRNAVHPGFIYQTLPEPDFAFYHNRLTISANAPAVVENGPEMVRRWSGHGQDPAGHSSIGVPPKSTIMRRTSSAAASTAAASAPRITRLAPSLPSLKNG